jgi:hypothetical protein
VHLGLHLIRILLWLSMLQSFGNEGHGLCVSRFQSCSRYTEKTTRGCRCSSCCATVNACFSRFSGEADYALYEGVVVAPAMRQCVFVSLVLVAKQVSWH